MAREMKDSGIEWIGDIPKHWTVHPIYCYFSERKNKNFSMKEHNLLSLSYGKIIKKDINALGGLLPASFNTYNIVERDDIIIRPTDLQNDKKSLRTGLVQEKGIITSAYLDLKPNKNVCSKFFHYLLHSYDVIKVFYNMGNGVRQGLTYGVFSSLKVIEPPLSEQQNIANYLDKKCSEIDNLTADIEKQISLLEDYKKSIITEAVTKGLNPNVEMKDSGIEWIGKIPKHWKISKLKYLIQVNNTKSSNNEYKYVGLENVIGWAGKLVDDTNMSESEFVPESSSNKAKKGDVLFGKLRPYLGKVFISEENIICSTEFLIMRPVDIEGKYLKLLFLSRDLVDVIDRSTYGTKMPRANSSFILNQYIPIPNTQEQNEISAFLDKKCSEIDSLISEKKKQLEKLSSYKQSMIYEYVTGKKEVPTQEIA